jgi:serine/threonine protein kinase
MKFSSKTIFQLGIKIINVLERIHSAGIIYNDMKFDNILVGNYKNNENTMHEIRMVDFGFASNYTDKAGNHLPETETEVFRSNMIFATIN